jgi:hypothetical protein
MIISHKHKYLFVELPRTGSTAVRRELRHYYDGTPILFKHATYHDFQRVANAEEKNYFVFSGIRNPLDEAVSLYFKYKTDHQARFSHLEQTEKNWLVRFITKKKYDFVQGSDADFSTYFMKHYWLPYSNWSALSHKEFDFVIRFENLADDFAQALRLIGLEAKRPLPVVNKTARRRQSFTTYYSPEAIRRAKRVFGPYMQQWGYEFPPEWNNAPIPWWNQMEFELWSKTRLLYWKYIRPRLHTRHKKAELLRPG